MIAIAEIPLQEVFALIGTQNRLAVPNTDLQLKIKGKRLSVIAANPICIVCGLVASIARVDMVPQQGELMPNINIYGIRNNKYVLFTEIILFHWRLVVPMRLKTNKQCAQLVIIKKLI